jgi:hypothetical protein
VMDFSALISSLSLVLEAVKVLTSDVKAIFVERKAAL